MCQCKRVQVNTKGRQVTLVVHKNLPSKSWGVQSKGYAHHVRRAAQGKRIATYAHRLTLLELGVRPEQLVNMHIHHQDNNKLNNCPYNLVLMPPEFNPTSSKRHPYTGQYIGKSEVEKLMDAGVLPDTRMPDWVMATVTTGPVTDDSEAGE